MTKKFINASLSGSIFSTIEFERVQVLLRSKIISSVIGSVVSEEQSDSELDNDEVIGSGEIVEVLESSDAGDAVVRVVVVVKMLDKSQLQ